MPIYTYRCTECNRKFEIKHRHDEEPKFPAYHKPDRNIVIHGLKMEDHAGEFIRVYDPPNLTGLPTRGINSGKNKKRTD